MRIWYRVSDLDAARAFYTKTLGFEEVYVDEEDRWVRLARAGLEIAVAEGERPESEDAPVAAVEVEDLRTEADRLRGAGVEVGTILEIPGAIRLVDVYDPDGNRLQLTEDI